MEVYFYKTISDTILNDLGSIIKVANNSNKEYLLTNREKFQNSSQHDHSSDDTSVGGIIKLFNFSASEKFVKDKLKEWTESGKSLNEQVKKYIL